MRATSGLSWSPPVNGQGLNARTGLRLLHNGVTEEERFELQVAVKVTSNRRQPSPTLSDTRSNTRPP